MLTVFADLVALIVGGLGIAYLELNISPSYYFYQSLVALRSVDFMVGITKTFAFGLIIGFTGCWYGLNTEGGTQGVGQATTKAVVTSSILITISDFVMTKAWLVYERGILQ
jgi:phospholipid/cholesterol/gamma-HCH transport system permease protein